MKQIPTDVIKFIQENISRLTKKSPAFFKVYNIINGLMVILAGVPAGLMYFKIVLPPTHWAEVLLRLCGAAGLWGYIMSKSTVDRDPIVINEQGAVVDKPKEVALPFTVKKEVQAQEKKINAPENNQWKGPLDPESKV